MTGPCSGSGVGQARSGFAALQYIGPAAIGGALAGLSGWQGAAVGATIGALTFDLATFCPDGPPAMPTFTADDIVALLAPIPTAARSTAALKFQDFIGNLFWPILCECSSGTSTLGSPSTYPSGGPETTGTPASTLGTCYSTSFTHALLAGAGDTLDTTASLLGVGATLLVLTASSTPHTAAQASTFTVSFTQNETVTNQPGSPVVTNANQGPLVRYFALPANLDTISITMHSAGNAGTTYTMSAQLDVYCGSNPNQSSSPCCPPDPATQATLDQLLAMVTLIQRQSVPFGYVYGANHAGLSGDGSIEVADLLGVSVDVTTLPASYGRAAGTPEVLFHLGYINLGTTDGWSASRRVEYDGTLFIPPNGGLYTTIGYSLAPGVEVSIRELVREP